MNWYFIILCILYSLGLGIIMARHGSPKDGNYNIFTALISVSIQLFLVVNAIRIGF